MRMGGWVGVKESQLSSFSNPTSAALIDDVCCCVAFELVLFWCVVHLNVMSLTLTIIELVILNVFVLSGSMWNARWHALRLFVLITLWTHE